MDQRPASAPLSPAATLEAPEPAPAGAPGEGEPGPAERPWTWGWFRWAPGQGWTFFWILLIHVTAAVGLVLFPWPGWRVVLVAYGLSWVGGIGTTVGYHRALAHRSLRLRKPVEVALTAAAIFNGSGSPATWVANHRLHHAKADGEGDISSPRIGGFWWSHLRWLYQARQSPIDRWAPDLEGGYYAFWTRWQIAILGLSFFAGLPFGWAAFFWVGALRLAFSLNAQCFVNSVAHMGPIVHGSSARNLLWLGFVHSFQGENWHANHHARPSSARIGWTWRQPDVGWWVIRALKVVSLARGVREALPHRAAGAPRAR